MVPSFGDVRKTILLNEMLGKATERVIDRLPGGVGELLLEVELLLVVVIELLVVETAVLEVAMVEL